MGVIRFILIVASVVIFRANVCVGEAKSLTMVTAGSKTIKGSGNPNASFSLYAATDNGDKKNPVGNVDVAIDEVLVRKGGATVTGKDAVVAATIKAGKVYVPTVNGKPANDGSLQPYGEKNERVQTIGPKGTIGNTYGTLGDRSSISSTTGNFESIATIYKANKDGIVLMKGTINRTPGDVVAKTALNVTDPYEVDFSDGPTFSYNPALVELSGVLGELLTQKGDFIEGGLGLALFYENFADAYYPDYLYQPLWQASFRIERLETGFDITTDFFAIQTGSVYLDLLGATEENIGLNFKTAVNGWVNGNPIVDYKIFGELGSTLVFTNPSNGIFVGEYMGLANTAVPEPSTVVLGLVSFSFMSLIIRRRRIKKRSRTHFL